MAVCIEVFMKFKQTREFLDRCLVAYNAIDSFGIAFRTVAPDTWGGADAESGRVPLKSASWST